MKKHFVLLMLCLLGVPAFAADAAPTEALVRIQTEPASGHVQAYFEKTIVVDGLTYRQPWQMVEWQIGGEKSITVEGRTYTYLEVFAAVQAIALQERAAATTPAPEVVP